MKRAAIVVVGMVISVWAVSGVVQSQQSIAAEALPTVDQVLTTYIDAVGGREAIQNVTTRTCQGYLVDDIPWHERPFEVIPVEAYAKAPDRILVVHRQRGGTLRDGVDGEGGWKQDAEGVRRDSGAVRSKLAWLLDPHNALRVEAHFTDLSVTGREKVGEREAWVLESADLEKAHHALYFDIETGLLIRIGYYWDLSDYREVDGVKLPFLISMSRKGGKSVYTFDEIIHNEPMNDTFFAMPGQ